MLLGHGNLSLCLGANFNWEISDAVNSTIIISSNKFVYNTASVWSVQLIYIKLNANAIKLKDRSDTRALNNAKIKRSHDERVFPFFIKWKFVGAHPSNMSLFPELLMIHPAIKGVSDYRMASAAPHVSLWARRIFSLLCRKFNFQSVITYKYFVIYCGNPRLN
jgi:hypothetical protein